MTEAEKPGDETGDDEDDDDDLDYRHGLQNILGLCFWYRNLGQRRPTVFQVEYE
jgi:hypothetical protein